MSVISYGNVTVTNINDGVNGTDGQMLYATCSTAADVAAKVATLASGTLTLTAGTTVAITFTYTNTAENPTLNVSSTGDIAIYAGNVNLSDIYNWQAGDTIVFVYNGTNWQITSASSKDRIVYKTEVTADGPILAGVIGVFNSNGKIQQLTAAATFDLSMPILYIGTAYETNKLTQTNNYTFWGTPFDLTATHSIVSAAGGRPVYIEGTINGNMFTPSSNVLICDSPQTTNSDYYYLRLGLMNTSTTAILESQHLLYSYIENQFQRVDKVAVAIATATKQYFWHDTQGAHVGTVSGNGNSGYNSLWNTYGLQLRNNTNVLAQFDASAVEFYDNFDTIASFGTDGITLGKDAATKITLDTTNGLNLGNKIQLNPSGDASFTGSIIADSGIIADLNINTVSIIEDQYPLYSQGDISATNVNDITVNDTTHIVTVNNNDTIVTYTFDAKYQTSNNEYENANFIYYSPIYSFSEDESGESSNDEVDVLTTIYYLLQPADADPPDIPTTDPPPIIQTTGYIGWTDTKPSYTPNSSLALYAVEQTKYTSDSSFEYTDPYLVDDDDGTNFNNQSQSSSIQNQVNINNVIDVTIIYLNINSNTQPITQTTIGTEVYTSSYRDSGWWNYQLNQTLLDLSTTVKVQFTLVAGATMSFRVGYGKNSALTYNTSRILSVDNNRYPSIYIGTNGISVSDKIGLFPNGTIQTNYIEVRGKGMEFINTNDERTIIIKNTAYDEGKTYAADGLYPHNCALYGGNSTSRMAIGIWDRRQNNAVWRYDDYDNVLRIEKKSVFYASLVPDTTNTRYLGVDSARFYAAYIGTIQIGEENYKNRTGGIFSKWKDNKAHYLLSRSTDGLTTIFGWSGSASGTSTVYHTSTQIKGYEVSLNSNGGGIKLKGGVTTSSSINAGGAIRTYGKTADNDGVAGDTFGPGTVNLVRDGNPAIYFYRNKATSHTNYLAETANGVLQTQKAFKSGTTLSAGAVTSYTPTWTSGHAPADYHCVVSAGICSFSYRGPTVAHSANTQIGVLPVGARPTSSVYCPFVKMSGGAVGCIRIFTTGAFEVMLITDTSSTGRLYFNCSFPVV